MIHHASVSSISWIPSEAVKGLAKLPFGAGVAHYDDPPPDRLESGRADLEQWRDADRFRFANHLAGWIETDEAGRIVGGGFGDDSGGLIGSTTMKLGKSVTVDAVALPDIQTEPEIGDGWVRFTQTGGGRTGVPAPRHVTRPPFVQIAAPLAWATLSLTIHADGSHEHELTGASPFPRHWVYGSDGCLTAKSGMTDFKAWYRHAFGTHSPWGDEDSPALATAVETALERELSLSIMRTGKKPRITKVKAGKALVSQGDEGHELFLLLDGVLRVDVDGEALAELGPGSVVGERAVLEGGVRTSTLTAVTPCKVAVASADELAPEALAELREGHRREEQPV